MNPLNCPWEDITFKDWRIKHLSQSFCGDLEIEMTHRDGTTISEVGNNEEYIWNRLWWKAYAHMVARQDAQTDPRDQHP